jgi:hypothetical protein
MRLRIEIPDISQTINIDLSFQTSMDDIQEVVSHVSSHFKNLQVDYEITCKNWNATMLTASAEEVEGLKSFKCIEKVWRYHK